MMRLLLIAAEVANVACFVALLLCDHYSQACTNMLVALYARSVRKDL